MCKKLFVFILFPKCFYCLFNGSTNVVTCVSCWFPFFSRKLHHFDETSVAHDAKCIGCQCAQLIFLIAILENLHHKWRRLGIMNLRYHIQRRKTGKIWGFLAI